MKFEERPPGSPEHLSKVDVQHVSAGVPGQPVDQVLLGITITVGQIVDGGVGCILGGPLDPDAGRQLIRVGRVQKSVHRVHQLTVQIVRRRRRRIRRRSHRLFETRDGHGAAERDCHYQSGRVCGPIHRGAAYISLSLCRFRRCYRCQTWSDGTSQATDVVISASTPFARCLMNSKMVNGPTNEANDSAQPK